MIFIEKVKEIRSEKHKCMFVTFTKESLFTIKFNGQGKKSI